MISLALLTVFFCVMFIYFQRYILMVYKARKHTSALPGWFTLPFIGNAYKFLGNTDVLFNCIAEATDMVNKHQGRMRLWVGPTLMIATTVPEDIKAVYNVFTERPYYFNFARPWLGNGLITATGETWKKNVKKLGVTFTTSFVEGFNTVFNSQARKLVETLKEEQGNAPFDILQKYLARMSLETICQTAMGVSEVGKDMVSNEYFTAFTETVDLVVQRTINPLHHFDFLYYLSSNYRQFTKNIKVLHELSNVVIEKKFREMEVERNNVEPPKEKFRAFIDILLEMSAVDPTLSKEQIRSEVDTIIASGQETSALSLSFVFLVLSKHPDIQEKVYQEIKQQVGIEDTPLYRKDLDRLVYLDAVLSEIIRMYPPILFAMRYIHKDFPLEEYTLPEGCVCLLPLWAIGRSVHNFGPDAHQFKPERWLDDTSKYPMTSPFGYGRRPCIGKRYAQSLVKIVVVQCIRELEFISDGEELTMKADITLRPKTGNLLAVRARRPNNNAEE